jgi:hypothetical protein
MYRARSHGSSKGSLALLAFSPPAGTLGYLPCAGRHREVWQKVARRALAGARRAKNGKTRVVVAERRAVYARGPYSRVRKLEVSVTLWGGNET